MPLWNFARSTSNRIECRAEEKNKMKNAPHFFRFFLCIVVCSTRLYWEYLNYVFRNKVSARSSFTRVQLVFFLIDQYDEFGSIRKGDAIVYDGANSMRTQKRNRKRFLLHIMMVCWVSLAVTIVVRLQANLWSEARFTLATFLTRVAISLLCLSFVILVVGVAFENALDTWK